MSLNQESDIFSKVFFRFKKLNYLNPITKSMIIQTFINIIIEERIFSGMVAKTGFQIWF